MKGLKIAASAALALCLSACTVSFCYRGACIVLQRSAEGIASLGEVADPSSVDFSTFVLKPQLVYSGARTVPPSSATLAATLTYTDGHAETQSFNLTYSSENGGYIASDVSSLNAWYAASYSNQSTIEKVDTDIKGLEDSGIGTLVLQNGKDVITTINVN